MKSSILLLLLLPLLAAAQKKYFLSGKLPRTNRPVKAYFFLKDGKWKEMDSAVIRKGVFSFRGNAKEPQQALLKIRYEDEENLKADHLKDVIEFYLESGRIRIVSGDSLRNARITGSRLNRENHQLKKATEKYFQTIKRLNIELVPIVKKNPEAVKEEWVKAKIDTLKIATVEREKINNEFIRTHPDSYIALSTFYDQVIQNGKFNADTALAGFLQFSAGVRSTSLGRKIAGRIANVAAVKAGDLAPDFTQPDLSGKPFTLSSLRGKYVFLDFWASWCVPCRQETPYIIKTYQMLQHKGLEIVSVSLDASRASWEAAIKKDGMSWINVSDLKADKNEAAALYGVSNIPRNLLIDPRGKIIAKDIRGVDLNEKIAAFMK